MKPLAYGYLRVTEDLEDDELRQLELGLQKLTDAEGFCLFAIFYECQPGYYGTFSELVEELKRTQARHVVVPSLDHLSRHPILRDQMLNRLEREADAQVWTVEP